MTEPAVRFRATPTVSKFLLSDAWTRLLRGPRGEGKTTSVYLDLVRESGRLDKSVLPLRSIHVRDTWTNMQRTTMENLRELQAMGLRVDWRERDTEAIVEDGRLHCFFVGLDTVVDLNKLQGFKAARLHIEEPAPVIDLSRGLPVEVFSVGATSLRQSGVPSRIVISMNPPDEDHWSAELPGRVRGLRRLPEFASTNIEVAVFDIPPGENKHVSPEQRVQWRAALELGGRGDLVSRLIHGKVGFVQLGVQVTPEYADSLHLAPGPLTIYDGEEIVRMWDGGQNPTCVWSQFTPRGQWNILGAKVGENIGMKQFLEGHVDPWERRFLEDPQRYTYRDIGDPSLSHPEQSNSDMSALHELEDHFPNFAFEGGPQDWEIRRSSAKAVLEQLDGRGRGRVQLDPQEAKPVRNALRGGVHYPKDSAGRPVTTVQAMKRASGMHSHPFDCFCYGAAVLFGAPRVAKRPAPRPFVRGSRTSWMSA